MNNRLWLIAFGFVLLFAAFAVRLFQLQVLQGGDYSQRIMNDIIYEEMLPAKRGRILDRKGHVLVDNQATWHISVRLKELEVSRSRKRLWPWHELSQERLSAFVSELAQELGRDPLSLKTLVEQELEDFPAVSIRYDYHSFEPIGLLQIPAMALQADENSELATLAARQLIQADMTAALAQDIRTAWDLDAHVWQPTVWAAFTSSLDVAFDCVDGYCAAMMEPYVYRLNVHPLEQETESTALVLVTPSRQRQAEDALSRGLHRERNEIEQILATYKRSKKTALVEERDSIQPYYYAPLSLAAQIGSVVPAAYEITPLVVKGTPPGRTRRYYIQGDNGNTSDGFFTRFTRRLTGSLGAEGEWIGALLLQHCGGMKKTKRGRILLNEDIDKNLVTFEPAGLYDWMIEFVRVLRVYGMETSVPLIESEITSARRLADRAWRGETTVDPLAIVRAVPKSLAMSISSSIRHLPRKYRKKSVRTDVTLPGVTISIGAGREYPYGSSAAHVLGRIGRVDRALTREEALTNLWDPDGWTGSSGLEKVYDDRLQGVVGSVRIKRKPGGKEERFVVREPQAGRDVVTTLDIGLQREAESCLAHWPDIADATEKMRKTLEVSHGRAGLILMDPYNGDILALASAPGYNPEDLRFHYKELIEASGNPLLDHATAAAQPPGSVMKIATSMAGFHYGKHKVGGTIDVDALNMRMRDHGQLGVIGIPTAIAKSSNRFYAELARKIGPEDLTDFFHYIGMGKHYALDIPWQMVGGRRTPTPATIGRYRPNEPWRKADTRTLAIGNFWAASPLEVITIPAMVVNGGTVVRPHVVAPARRPDEHHVDLALEEWQEIKDGMELVTTSEGTVRHRLDLSGKWSDIKVAAKTGTSEWGRKDPVLNPDHAWLIGYAPAENPVICFAIFIHSGTSGGRACAPVMKRLLEYYFESYGKAGH